MDTDFKEIINNNEGWIITINKNGKSKFCICTDEQFNKTREYKDLHDEELPVCSEQENLFINTKIARYFIRDVIQSKHMYKCFDYNGKSFRLVEIYGIITSMYNNGNKKCLIVDDGTSGIICIMDLDYGVGKIEQNKFELDELYEVLAQDSTNVLAKAAISMTKCSHKILNKVPNFNDVSLGDQVKLIGNLSEYNGVKYVFITKIIKDDDDTECIVIYSLLQLYENVYN